MYIWKLGVDFYWNPNKRIKISLQAILDVVTFGVVPVEINTVGAFRPAP